MYPILFELGPVTIFSKWLFIALGFVAGSLLFVRLSKRNRIKLNVLTKHSFALFFWTLIVSRIFFVLLNWDLFFYQFHFKNILKLFEIWDKGFSFWGAVITWFLGVWYFSKKEGESGARLFDVMAPCLLLGMAIGSVGAFLDGINYGTPTSLPWSISFHSANVKYVAPIHPTQLYAAFYTLILTWGAKELFQRNRGRLAGFVFEISAFAFCAMKFIEEFFRGDETFEILSLRVPQILALIGAILAAYAIYIRYTNKRGGDPDAILQKFVQKLLKKVVPLKRGINCLASPRLGLLRKSNPPEIAEKMIPLQNQAT
ncbi:prolipoprotein diacylglyceryl transferase [Candidatus Peregrinibacteria bacterium]|nr:prolipoprotein diacylglyceryl transferase [Candidatus Peregrinibacteria bacterium]